jgi:hypothetical protein
MGTLLQKEAKKAASEMKHKMGSQAGRLLNSSSGVYSTGFCMANIWYLVLLCLFLLAEESSYFFTLMWNIIIPFFCTMLESR